MDKRYQVFVSSTFEDLREERSAVTSALLQLECFPAGMELFPAADDDSLTLIKSVIDDSDYYLVMLAGRYGSVDHASGKSYTQLEYEYAIETGKPTIALIHSAPESLVSEKTERTDEGRRRFEEFSAILRKKNCRLWKDRAELTAAVFTGIQHLKKTRPAIGWSRGSGDADSVLKDELIRVRRDFDLLNAELAEAKFRSAPGGVDELSQGSEKTDIVIDFKESGASSYGCYWEHLFRSVLPLTLGAGANEDEIASAIAATARESGILRTGTGHFHLEQATLSRNSFGKVINQMVALGLVEAKRHPAVQHWTLWHATPYGLREGSRLIAIKRGAFS